MRRVAVLLLLALVVALAGALATWLVLVGAQSDAIPAGPASEINEMPLYNGAVNVEKEGASPSDFADIRYEADAEVAAVETFYVEQLSRSGWESDWVRYLKVGGDSVNLDWRAPKYDDTVRRHFYKLGTQHERPYDVSIILEVSDNGVVNGAAARTLVEISLVRIPRLDELPVMPGAAEVERAGHVTTYRTAASVAVLTDYYTGILPEYGWTYRGPMIDPVSREDLPGTMLFGYVSHGLGAYLQIKTEPTADGKLSVNIRARGSELGPEQ